jgi:hypothetical protein
MCAQILFASQVDAGDAQLVGEVVGLLLDQIPVDPAPLAGELQAVVRLVALVATVDEYSEAGVEARTSSFRDLR